MLPEITVPDGTPSFLATGHDAEEVPTFAVVKLGTGHSRTRRLYTAPERIVSVGWFLTQEQMAALDDWFEKALLVGSNFFSIQVQDQTSPDLLWWKAKWVKPWDANPVEAGNWEVTGQLRLYGEGSVSGPASTPLSMSISVPMIGTATLTVDQPLNLSFNVALVSPESLGLLAFTVDLTQIVPGEGSILSRAFMFPDDLAFAAPGGSAAKALTFMG